MKKIYFLLCAVLFFASGCFSTTEDFTIEANGSGVYNMKMDMSGMFDMIDAMKDMAGEELDSSERDMGLAALDQRMDTTIKLGTFTDTSSSLTAEEKSLMKDATMHMVMNKAQNKFVMDFHFPYSKLTDITKIMALSQKNGNIMGKVLGGSEGSTTMPETPEFGSIFDYTFKDGLLEKKLNAEAYKQLKESPQFGQISGAQSMLSEATMNSVIRLPRKAKKWEGTGVKLSDDGKTVTINGAFTDIFDNPNALTFRIEY
jgi:hypothetical protein